jgi:hypothetical protein
MRFSSLLLFAGLLALVFGVGFFVWPAQLLSVYDASTGPVGYLMARFFGAALIQVGMVFFLIRDVQEPALVRAIARGGMVGSLAGLIVAVSAQRQDLVNAVGWSTILIYGLLSIVFVWFGYGQRRQS